MIRKATSGNVGIGTASPYRKLSIEGGDMTAGLPHGIIEIMHGSDPSGFLDASNLFYPLQESGPHKLIHASGDVQVLLCWGAHHSGHDTWWLDILIVCSQRADVISYTLASHSESQTGGYVYSLREFIRRSHQHPVRVVQSISP